MKSARFLSFLYTALHFHFLFLLPSLSQRETFDAAHNAKTAMYMRPSERLQLHLHFSSSEYDHHHRRVLYAFLHFQQQQRSRLKSKHENEELFPLSFLL